MNMPSGNFQTRTEELIKALDHYMVQPEVRAIPEVYEVLSVLSHLATSNAAAILSIVRHLEDASRQVETLLDLGNT